MYNLLQGNTSWLKKYALAQSICTL